MKKLYLAVIMLALLMAACGAERAANLPSGDLVPPKETLRSGEVIACYADCSLPSAQWGVAMLVTPASDGTREESEVQWRYSSLATESGAKSWVRKVISRSHPAAKDELAKGTVVLYGPPNAMRLGVVRDLIFYRNRIAVESSRASRGRGSGMPQEVDLKYVRIPDEPTFDAPAEDMPRRGDAREERQGRGRRGR